MNTYSKYCPNVFVAKCEEKHEKGDIIEMTTKYGQTHEAIVFNYLGATKDGQFCYSIVRADGYNVQERAKAKAERLQQWAANAEKKSNKYWEASKEGADFLVLAEPIKIGHHSEKRHRALIERNHNRMAKCVEFSDKSKEYDERSEYWEKQANVINLSMPESIEYFEFELEKAKERHAGIKNGSIKREHSFSLAYAGKAVKELESKLLIAKKLWA
jgi:hypothetical protein